MNENADAICKNCKHFRQTEPDPRTLQRATQCWWGPPSCTILPDGRGNVMPITMRTPVQPTESCGQFVPRLDG